MPTYEYQCESCGATFDIFQSIKASPLRKAECETCDSLRPVRRLIGTGGAILFKGSGFYETDYRSEGYKKAAKAESEAGKKASKESSGKADAKTTSTNPDKKPSTGGAASKTSSE